MDRMLQMDIAARNELKLRMEKVSLAAYAGWASSSGLRMATELRRFWYEYFERFGRYGPTSLPSSFNILEAFIAFDESFSEFSLREERDHLLRFSQYLDWYTASSFPEEPLSLVDIMQEGIAYSYDFVLDPTEPLLSADDFKLLIAGVSLIRHGDEVAVLVLAGETPPGPAHMAEDNAGYISFKGKEDIRPSDEADEQSRLLEEMPNYSRVLLASRFDLSNKLNDVRYLLHDVGNAYHISTDDHDMLRASYRAIDSMGRFDKSIRTQAETLQKYADLFSAAATSLFLPVFFIAESQNIVTSEFLTTMGVEQKSIKVKHIRRVLGDRFFRPRARVVCLAATEDVSRADEYKIDPPDMHFQSSGYWRALQPVEIGKSADGVPIVGKTWVHRTEVWESTAPSAFVARTLISNYTRRDHIYVMRSPSHAGDVYKIGFTTRDVASRQHELTRSTSTPLPFEILATWPVEDATTLELEIHKRLAPYRLSQRREFFRLPLPQIIKVIETIVSGNR
jgi:hypothetical protein